MLDARALDAVRFTPAQLGALQAAIRVNDVVDPQAALPRSVGLDHDQTQLVHGFCLSRRLWREAFDPAVLIEMAATLRRGEPFERASQARFKEVRAAFKHLRFAFVLYAADHRCPPMFKAVTTVMGQLQDAFRGERHTAARRQAALLRILLGRLPRLWLAREVDRLVPSDPADFRAFVAAEMAALGEMLACETITGHRFHAARKIVSRQVSFHDDMRTLLADAEHIAMSRYLSAINGSMGRFHDGLVTQRTRGTLDYARDGIVLPPDIRDRLEALVALYAAAARH